MLGCPPLQTLTMYTAQLVDILEVPMPEVKFFTHPPVFNIISGIEPAYNPAESTIRVVRATAKFHNDVQFVVFATTATEASI